MHALTLFLALAADAGEPEVGKPAPAIDLPATQIDKVLPDNKDAKTLSLKDLHGKKNVVLFFYPKAMTPGCTLESCGFTKLDKELAALDTVAIGISTDTLEDQQKFTEKEKLTTPLLADPDKKVTMAYHVLNPKNGKAQRVTFVIDKKGVVRQIYTKVTPNKHPQDVLEYIKENLAK